MKDSHNAVLTFALYEGERLSRREKLAQAIIKLGSDPKSELRLGGEAVARMHAVIEIESQDRVTLIDLGNETGTLVNGARVNKCRLTPHDEIEIGAHRVVLERVDSPPRIAAAASAADAQPALAEARGSEATTAAVCSPSTVSSAEPATASNPFAQVSGPLAPDPFAMPVAASAVADDAPEGSYEYRVRKCAPDVPADECESAAEAVDVRIYWGRNLLSFSHLSPPRPFYVGEEESKHLGCDYFLPEEKLGATRAPLVLTRSGTVFVVLLPGSSGTVDVAGHGPQSIAEVISSGLGQSCPELGGAYQVPLGRGGSVDMRLGDLHFELSAVRAGRRAAAPFTLAALATGAMLYMAISFAGHVGLLAALAAFMPPLGATAEDALSEDQRILIQQYIDDAAEQELEARESHELAEAQTDQPEGGTGRRSIGEEGSMGDPTAPAADRRFAVRGPQDNPDPRIARLEALRDAASFGMIALINTGAGGDPDAPTAPWGREDALGNDPLSARGNMWGNEMGAAFGVGGLGLSGIGEGGGGDGEGIGLGTVGTIGHGAGTGVGQGFGPGGHGLSSGRYRKGHDTGAPRLRSGETNVKGRLPPEVIQRIVRQNFGRYRLCYQNGLRQNPSLAGRVVIHFVIGRDGRVSRVGGGGDLPDAAVISCVTRAFYGLTFPQPEGGVVSVSYPLTFSPGPTS